MPQCILHEYIVEPLYNSQQKQLEQPNLIVLGRWVSLTTFNAGIRLLSKLLRCYHTVNLQFR